MQMAHMDVCERKAKTAGSSVLTFRLRDIRLCQSALVVRLGDFRLDPPSQGHPSGSSVSGTSVWILRLRVIRLEPPSRGHPSRPSNHINGSYFNHHSQNNLTKY